MIVDILSQIHKQLHVSKVSLLDFFFLLSFCLFFPFLSFPFSFYSVLFYFLSRHLFSFDKKELSIKEGIMLIVCERNSIYKYTDRVHGIFLISFTYVVNF